MTTEIDDLLERLADTKAFAAGLLAHFINGDELPRTYIAERARQLGIGGSFITPNQIDTWAATGSPQGATP